MPRQRRAGFVRHRATALTPALRVYLESGDWQRALDEVREGEAPDSFSLFLLAGQVMRPDGLAVLRELWQAHGVEIVATWRSPGRPWAEKQLEELGERRRDEASRQRAGAQSDTPQRNGHARRSGS